MARYSYEVTAASTAPPERVFALLADATSWPRWAGAVIAYGGWEREGEPPPGGVGAIRKVGRWPAFGYEEMVAYDPPSHHAYLIAKGQPVRDYRAEVDTTPEGTGTRIVWRGSFEPKIPGTGAIVNAFYRRLIGSFARRVARYAEHGD